MNHEHDPIQQRPIHVGGGQDSQLTTNDIHFVGRDTCGKCLRPLRSESTMTIPNIIFDSENTLRIEQRVHRSDQQCGRQLHVFGRLDICSSGESSNRGRVEIKIISGDKKLTAATKIHFDDHFVDISTPFLADWWDKDGPKPCVKLLITVYMPCDAQLDILELKVDSLDVSVMEGLKLKVADKMSITTFSGSVRVPSFSRTGRTSENRVESREMLIQTYSGAIEGGFSLHDLLKIKSGSGSVFLELGLVSTESATSAKLSVETEFGNIRITTPFVFYYRQSKKGYKNKPPSRDYIVELETTSGKIEADVVVASRATVRSRAGDVLLRLVPVPFSARGNGKTTVVTDVDYGKTRIFLLESSYSGAPCADKASSTTELETTNTSSNSGLAGLHSAHRSISGDIKVDVPDDWSGELIADTHTGDITSYGKHITIMRSSQGEPRMMEGLRGSRDSSVRMKSLWGSLELFVGQPQVLSRERTTRT
ncbi:hypothetical protein E4U22_005642 [Claviceps purpurea]|nr:hypothetical protein E4U38_000782 [Claviceps purpurea]KAG6159267.1 hypothetical protein E4U37_004074 [Claviceps purpurea]KAG6163894.1 hypothetical protein E4U11_001587 [Claviceps purpurea]KAG6243126.1 hypothetical protein E4U25_001906 [Claviceps purpurea]KAG6323632.1 hypothetical protein E4U22_005642 [Claviceps purpurea]